MTNVAEPQVLPPQAPQAPGSLINNPSRIGLNVGPGTLVYRTSYGYLIVNPGGESIALSPSLNVIRQQTQLSNIRTTAVSQVVGTGGAIGAEGKPATPTTTKEIVQAGGRSYEVVRDVYGNVVRTGNIPTPEPTSMPSPLAGQILTPSQIKTLERLPVGAPVSAVIPKPLQPAPVSDISRLQKLGFSTEGLTASYDPETGRLTTVQYPERISPIPSGLGYQPITIGRTTYKPAPPTEAEKYALYSTLKSTQDFSKAISEGAEKYLIPLVPYTPVGAVRPTESKAFVRGIVGGVASIPEFFAAGALGAEYVGREIAAGRGKALPEAFAIGAVEMGRGLITSFREKPIETTGQFIGQSLVFGGIESGIREIKIPTEKMFGTGYRLKYQPTALKIETEVFGKPTPPRAVTSQMIFGKGTITPIENVLANIPKTIPRISSREVFGRGDISKQIAEFAPKPKPVQIIPFGEYEGWSRLQSPINIKQMSRVRVGKPIKPVELSVPERIEVYPYGRYIELPRVTDILKTPKEEEIPIPKIRMPEELPEIPKIRIPTTPEEPKGKVFVQRDLGVELRQKWAKSQAKLEKEAKTGAFQVTKQGQIVLMEKPITELKPKQITIQVEKQLAKQRLKPLELQREKAITRQRTRLFPVILPMLTPRQIAKTAQITRQASIPRQIVIQRTTLIPTQKADTALASVAISRTALKPVSVTEQISPQISKQIAKQAQQQEQITKQIQRQVQQFEIPTEQILKLKLPSDVTEPFFTRKRKKAKKKSRIQKVYAPVLNPLFDVVMQKAAKTKPFKIIDITKEKRKRG